ncbi:MAG: ABC transporter permease [Prevotellaceae bacterium]|nr:ABC transporter permease [Prevotellaceae bacterium]
MVIGYLIEKELKQIVRNKFLPKLFFMLPTVMLLIMPWAANQEVKGLKLSVVDNDHSSMSRRLIQKADASEYFTLTDVSASNKKALHSVESGDADLILEIEKGFEKNLETTGIGRVMISANAVNGVKSGLGSSYLGSIVTDFSNDMKEETGLKNMAVRVQKFNTAPYYEFNPHLDYKVFMVPALMVMMLTLLSGFLPALNIVGEKEKGTIEQMNVTPVGKFPFVLSKLAPYWLVGFLVLTYSMLLAWLVYGLVPAGNLLTIYLFATIYILVVSGLGLVISNNSATMQQALFVMFFFLMIFILMSGLFTPVSSMPEWAQMLTKLNPLRYFIEVMRMVYLKGSSFTELIPYFRALTIFAVVLNVWAILSYKKSN